MIISFVEKLKLLLQGSKVKRFPDYKVSLRPDPFEYQIISNGIVLGHTIFQSEAESLLTSQRITPGSSKYDEALAGKPFIAAGVSTRLIRIERG